MRTSRSVALVTVFAVVAASGTGYAAAQSPSSSSSKSSTASPSPSGGASSSSASSPESGGDVTCPAVHMLLAPGTSETARFAEPNKDTHGFLSQSVARPALGAINEQTVRDLSGGFAQLLNLPEGMAGPLGDAAVSATSRDQAREQEQAPELTRTYITYPATVGGAQPPGQTQLPENAGDLTSYEESSQIGIDMTNELMAEITDRCPDTKLFLTGFSQGGRVISEVAREIGAGESDIDAEQIAGVSLFADPTREGGTPLQPEGASTIGAVPGTSGEHVAKAVTGLDRMPTANAGGLGTDKSGHADFGALSDRVVSWCLTGDYVCGLPVESELVTDIVKQLEPMSLGDPVAALKHLAKILERAVRVGDISEVADINFGGAGFSTRPDGGAETPVLQKRVSAAAEDTTNETPGQMSSSSSAAPSEAPGQVSGSTSVAPEGTTEESAATDDQVPATSSAKPEVTPDSAVPTESPAAAAEPGQGNEAAPVEPPAETVPQGPPSPAPAPGMPGLPALPELPPLPSPEQVGQTVVGVAAGLGGMALGAGITVARKTLTPENLAQVALAGVSGGPAAAAGVAQAQLTGSAMSLLEPGSASGYARQTLQILEDNGIPVPEQAEMAVALVSWLSTSEHNGYGERPMLPDGRSGGEATTDWVKAITADLEASEAGEASEAAPSTSAPVGEETSSEGIDALENVDFDSDKATKALATLDTKEADLSTVAATTSSSSPQETTSSSAPSTASTTSSGAPTTTSEVSTSIEGN